MRHGKSHFVVFLALNSPEPYHRYFKLWQREPGFLPRLGQKPRPLQPVASLAHPAELIVPSCPVSLYIFAVSARTNNQRPLLGLSYHVFRRNCP